MFRYNLENICDFYTDDLETSDSEEVVEDAQEALDLKEVVRRWANKKYPKRKIFSQTNKGGGGP